MTTQIGWTDETWNPSVGCTKVSPGCKNCYAETLHPRLAAMGWSKYAEPFSSVRPWPDHLDKPLHWRKPRRIFVNSMSDLFHEHLPLDYVARVFGVMEKASRHTFQVLTKRAERMADFIEVIGNAAGRDAAPPNVWLGVSIEDQHHADERIPHLLNTPAAVRFLSCEPLLGPIRLWRWLNAAGGPTPWLCWVIVGGESGPGYREMNLTWLRDIVDQCVAAGVPVFVKQDSHRLPGQQGRIPDDLWAFKQFPEAA